MKLTTGVNFINILRAAFAQWEPKSIKKAVKLSIFLCFWDLRAKAARKYVGEIDPKCQFNQHSTSRFVLCFLTHKLGHNNIKLLVECNGKVGQSFVGETKWHQLCVLKRLQFTPTGW